MKTFILGRLLVWVKRGVKALESIAESQRAIAEAAVAPTRKPIKPKMAEVFTASSEDRNKAWQRQRDEDLFGEQLDVEND